MTESAYLKCSVGPVLVKAVAETVLAQPSNPQEYLALYLLHVLQEEERAVAAAARKRKAEAQRQERASSRALREKCAADTIRRFFLQYRSAMRTRRAEEAALWGKYGEAMDEAEELLNDLGLGDRDVDGDEGNAAAIEEAAAEVEDARGEFYKAQRFMHYIRKAFIGDLKTELVARREQVRVAQDKMHDTLDATGEAMRGEEEAKAAAAAAVAAGTLPNSATVAPLTKKLLAPRHERISTPMILYRVMRCWCYLLLDSTPKQTDTPAKVAALVKPFIFMQLLRAFNPVATYKRSRPLRIEDMKKMNDDSGGAADDVMQESEEEPLQQPKPRQVRRVSRILRVLMHDGEYISSVNPADYIDKDDLENEEELAEMDAASAAAAHGAELRVRVEETARKHSVMLYAMLRLLSTASAYREARDRWVALLQENGREPPPSEEMPEEEDMDPHNEEALRDDEGEVDEAAKLRLLLAIGTDTDEALAKLWAETDETLKAKWKAIAAAREEEEGEDANEEDEDEEAPAGAWMLRRWWMPLLLLRTSGISRCGYGGSGEWQQRAKQRLRFSKSALLQSRHRRHLQEENATLRRDVNEVHGTRQWQRARLRHQCENAVTVLVHGAGRAPVSSSVNALETARHLLKLQEATRKAMKRGRGERREMLKISKKWRG